MSPSQPSPPDHYLEPVIGWRGWIAKEDHRLGATFMRAIEYPLNAPLEAVHYNLPAKTVPWVVSEKHHLSPAEKCMCGANCYGTLERAIANHRAVQRYDNALVVGAAVAWGRVTIHGEGFRAQYLRPLALLGYPPKDTFVEVATGPKGKKMPVPKAFSLAMWTQRVERIGEAYNIPVLPASVIEDYAATWGVPLSAYQS